MPRRLLLILALLVQQLMLPAVMAGTPKPRCEDASCCAVVEATTCCGTTVRMMRCVRTGEEGGACRCAGPGDSEQVPEAPRPREQRDIVPIVVTAASVVVDMIAPVHLATCRCAPAICRTHGETQALLCIWRT